MTNSEFDIIFEYMNKEKEIQSQTNEMYDALIQSKEIRKLADIIEDMKSVENPILYSGT